MVRRRASLGSTSARIKGHFLGAVVLQHDGVCRGCRCRPRAPVVVGVGGECKLLRAEDPLWAHTSEAGPRTRMPPSAACDARRMTPPDAPPDACVVRRKRTGRLPRAPLVCSSVFTAAARVRDLEPAPADIGIPAFAAVLAVQPAQQAPPVGAVGEADVPSGLRQAPFQRIDAEFIDHARVDVLDRR